MTLLLLAGCSTSSVSQKEMEDLVGQARVDAAAKQFADAEQKLLKCLEYADKDSHLYLRLKALNQLVDLELKRQRGKENGELDMKRQFPSGKGKLPCSRI